MNAPATPSEVADVAVGASFYGGFFAGKININGGTFALIVAPKADGEIDDVKYNADWRKDINGAKSYNDGLANTNAMAEAGSDLAEWARDLRINGFDDWYIPSQDELEVIYRNLKPTSEENNLYMRSGVNASAIPPTYPYTEQFPAQTSAGNFQEGGSEAFEDDWYWTSTQHAANSDYAWCQSFYYGDQNVIDKGNQLRARAVRRLVIE